MNYILIAIISYFIGSIPTAYLMGRLVKKIDIREFGSGNVGATNAFRVLGKKYGIITLALDMLKGFIPIVLARNIYPENYLYIQLTAGFFLVIGHIFTIFLNFRGGKGVATACGFLLALTPIPMLFSVIIFLIVFSFSGYVSLGSIIASLSYPVLTIIWRVPNELQALAAILAVLIILKHKTNIRCLIDGSENRVIFRKIKE